MKVSDEDFDRILPVVGGSLVRLLAPDLRKIVEAGAGEIALKLKMKHEKAGLSLAVIVPAPTPKKPADRQLVIDLREIDGQLSLYRRNPKK